jgi:hypothetical protein
VAKSNAVLAPTLGLIYDKPHILIPARGLQDGQNFRIKNGQITTLNLGWARFGTFTLDGPCRLIDAFFERDGTQHLIFGTLTDLYEYIAADDVRFLTPIYATGTVTVVGDTVTGSGTTWTTNAKPGDKIYFGGDTYRAQAGPWYEIETVDSNTQLTLTEDAVDQPAGTQYTLRQVFEGETQFQWSTTTFLHASPGDEDLWFATNGLDYIVSWDGSASQVTVESSLGWTAAYITNYKNMLVAFNIREAGEILGGEMRNSDVGVPLDFSTGLASVLTVHSGGDEIIEAIPMGDSLVVYSTGNVTVADFVGDPFIFAFRTAASGLGPLNGNLIADFGDFHEFVGPDTKYSFDGVTISESDSHVWREILRVQDPNRYHMSLSHFDEENGDLIWGIPRTTDADAGTSTGQIEWAYVQHYLEGDPDSEITPYSKRQFPFSASGFYQRSGNVTWDQLTDDWEQYNYRWNDRFFSGAFPYNLVGADDGTVWILNESQYERSLLPLENWVHFGRRALGDGVQKGLLARVYPFTTTFEVSEGLTVTTYLYDSAQGNSTGAEENLIDLALPEDGWYATPYRVARFCSLQFGSPGGYPWHLSGYDIEVRPGGRR